MIQLRMRKLRTFSGFQVVDTVRKVIPCLIRISSPHPLDNKKKEKLTIQWVTLSLPSLPPLVSRMEFDLFVSPYRPNSSSNASEAPSRDCGSVSIVR